MRFIFLDGESGFSCCCFWGFDGTLFELESEWVDPGEEGDGGDEDENEFELLSVSEFCGWSLIFSGGLVSLFFFF